VNVSVVNPNGTVADTINLGSLAAGQQSFAWANGTPGTQYTYQVNATDAAGNAVSATPYSVYTVEGVNVSGSSPTLNVHCLLYTSLFRTTETATDFTVQSGLVMSLSLWSVT